MKKILAGLLIGAVVFSLAACGSGTNNNSQPADSAQEAENGESGEGSGSAANEGDASDGSEGSDSASPADGEDGGNQGDSSADTADGGADSADGSDYGYVIPAFDSEDLYGNAVSSDIFAEKDVTMVNCWGTFCPPCIGEMPDLQALSEKLPDNAQMIGIVIDVAQFDDSLRSDGVSIVEEAGVKFTNVILDDALAETFSPQIQYVPTTFFVDSQGKLLCDPVIGASIDAYVTQLEALLDGWKYE